MLASNIILGVHDSRDGTISRLWSGFWGLCIVAAQCCMGLDADLVVLLVHHAIAISAQVHSEENIEEALCPRLLHGLLTYDLTGSHFIIIHFL